MTDENHISGGFSCLNEPFDSVSLEKNNAVKTYLTEPMPGANEKGFSYNYSTPENTNDKISTAHYQTANDSVFIYSLINEIISGVYGRLNSFLLFKNNRLVCEEYFYGYTKDDLHPLESSTKSVTSLLIGIAKDKGFIVNLDQSISAVFPEYSNLKERKYRQISIKNLLTVTSGYDPDNENLFKSHNRIDYTLKREVVFSPGEKFQYDGGNTEILGGILKKQTGYQSMAGALELLPRDMGKLGILVLNNGIFSGKHVVSEDWINESTLVKTNTHISGDDYSYHWWNLHLKSEGKTYECIWANGWGSQFIYIFPELEVVIVTTGHNYEGDSWAITTGISKYLYLLKN